MPVSNPTGLTLTDNGPNEFNSDNTDFLLSWNHVVGATAYQVFLTLNDGVWGGDWTLARDIQANTASFPNIPTSAGEWGWAVIAFTATDHASGVAVATDAGAWITSMPSVPPGGHSGSVIGGGGSGGGGVTTDAPALADAFAYFTNDVDAKADPSSRDEVQAKIEACDLNAWIASQNEGTGLKSGCRLSTEGDMTVTVDKGEVSILYAISSVVRTILTFEDPDNSGQCRRDAIRVGLSGIPYITKGESASQPVCAPLLRNTDGKVVEVHLGWVLIEPDMGEGIDTTTIQRRGFPIGNQQKEFSLPAVQYEPIVAADGLASLSHSGFGWSQDFTVYDPTPGFEAYYCLWYNSLRQPVLGRRGIHEQLWVRSTLNNPNSITQQPPEMGVADSDGHAVSPLGIDQFGYIHIAGNQHAGPLRYIRSNNSMWDEDDPGNIKAGWTAHAMSGQNEAHITFPVFFNTPGTAESPVGTLFFASTQSGDYGGPSAGNFSLKRCDASGPSGSTWTELGRASSATAHSTDPGGALLSKPSSGWRCIVNGEEVIGGANMFPGSMNMDREGNLHVVFNWRGGDENGLGAGWWYFRLSGLEEGVVPICHGDPNGENELTLPLVYYNSSKGAGFKPPKISNFPSGHVEGTTDNKFVNNPTPSIFVTPADTKGFPHLGFKYVVGVPHGDPPRSGVMQQFHLWYDDSVDDSEDSRILVGGWHVTQVTSFTALGASIDGAASGPVGSASTFQPFCTPDGNVYFIGNWMAEGMGGALWCYDLTGLADGVAPAHPWKLHELPDQGDFHINYNLALEGTLGLLAVDNQRYWQNPADPLTDATFHGQVNLSSKLASPTAQLGWLRIDMMRMQLFRNKGVILPTIREVRSSTAQNITKIGASSPTGLGPILGARMSEGIFSGGNGAAINIGPEFMGKQLFARVTACMHATGGTNGWCALAILSQALQVVAPQNPQYRVGGRFGSVPPLYMPSASGPDKAGLSTTYEELIACVAVEDGEPELQMRSSAWVAIPNFRELCGTTGRLILETWVGSGGEGTITSATISLGVLEH